MAIALNGTTEYLHTAAAVATATPIAMSAWFWMDPLATSTGILLSIAAPDPSVQRFALYVSFVPSITLRAQTSGPSLVAIASATTAPTKGAWHHGFAVFSSATLREVWLDGGSKGSNTTSQTPVGLSETLIGASKIVNPTSPLFGRVAEAAIWAGSGVQNMGAREAAVLAAGFSPLCLGERLNRLVSYQPLVRNLNWPGIGPTLTGSGSPAVVAQPRVVYPTGPAVGLHRFPSFQAPYRPATAAVDAHRAAQGSMAAAGVAVGETHAMGEVS